MNPIARFFRVRNLKKTIARMRGQVDFLAGQQHAITKQQLKLEKAIGRAEEELWRVDGSATIDRMMREPTTDKVQSAIDKAQDAVKIVQLKFIK